MAEVYKNVGKKTIEEFIANHGTVQRALGDVQVAIYHEARKNLEGHRETGKATITLERGDVDRYVHLNDKAAMSIEFGRRPNDDDKGGMKGLFILSDAARKIGGAGYEGGNQ